MAGKAKGKTCSDWSHVQMMVFSLMQHAVLVFKRVHRKTGYIQFGQFLDACMYLRFKLLKYKENNKNICDNFDHNFRY